MKTLILPCTKCGNPAVSVTPPAMSTEVRKLMSPVLKLASIKYGERIELPKDDATWLDIFGSPSQLAEALNVECAFCARLLEAVATV